MSDDDMAEPTLKLEIDGTATTLDLEGLQALRKRLRGALRSARLEGRDILREELVGAEAFVDADGSWRLGTWLLEARDEGAVLVRRERAGRSFLLHVARLGLDEQGDLIVTAVDAEYLPLEGRP